METEEEGKIGCMDVREKERKREREWVSCDTFWKDNEERGERRRNCLVFL